MRWWKPRVIWPGCHRAPVITHINSCAVPTLLCSSVVLPHSNSWLSVIVRWVSLWAGGCRRRDHGAPPRRSHCRGETRAWPQRRRRRQLGTIAARSPQRAGERGTAAPPHSGAVRLRCGRCGYHRARTQFIACCRPEHRSGWQFYAAEADLFLVHRHAAGCFCYRWKFTHSADHSIARAGSGSSARQWNKHRIVKSAWHCHNEVGHSPKYSVTGHKSHRYFSMQANQLLLFKRKSQILVKWGKHGKFSNQ